jgi:nitronate monooxygenase
LHGLPVALRLFVSWKDHDDYTTGRLADPRSFCIQKTCRTSPTAAMKEPGGGQQPDVRRPRAYRFKQDPFYSNALHADVKQLVDRILTGD